MQQDKQEEEMASRVEILLQYSFPKSITTVRQLFLNIQQTDDTFGITQKKVGS
jgi:hypothetical protein